MKNTENLIDGALVLLKEMQSHSLELLKNYRKEDLSGVQASYQYLLKKMNALRQLELENKVELHHAYYSAMIKNIDFSLNKVKGLLIAEDREKMEAFLEFQLYPFLLEFWEEVYYWGKVYPDPVKMKKYYDHEFASHHENQYEKKNQFKYKVSIFMPVYNKLEYTRQCLDSIYKYTDFLKHHCELIIINDGSYDGTQNYIESLGIKKAIQFKENVKAMIFTLAMRICEGEFAVFVNNDTIVTEGWLDNLMRCIESDPQIICAAPMTSNVANIQEYKAEYKSLDELQIFAKSFNVSDPLKWELRTRIMPVIAVYRLSLVNRIGFADRLFYTLEFWDDDFSFRARRAGYKQMLCRDTYCHHFGSVTGKSAQQKENTLQKGRDLFFSKNGVDAWGTGFAYDWETLGLLNGEPRLMKKNISILGIDCGFGGTLLQLKNIFTSMNQEVSLCTITTDVDSANDLRPISEEIQVQNSMEIDLSGWKGRKFDYIYIGQPIEQYLNGMNMIYTLIEDFIELGGCILFFISNKYYQPRLLECSSEVEYINFEELLDHLKPLVSRVKQIASQGDLPDLKEFVSSTFPGKENDDKFMNLLSSDQFKFCCIK